MLKKNSCLNNMEDNEINLNFIGYLNRPPNVPSQNFG